MKLGLCCSVDLIEKAREAGAEYIEPALAALRDKTDGDLHEIRKRAEGSGIPIDGFNCFFGGGISLYGDSMEKIGDYLKRNDEVARILGSSYCVVGGGGIRKVPENIDREFAEERFARIVDLAGNMGKEAGVAIYLEPLGRQETNLVNTLTEGLLMCRKIDNPNVKCLVDFFHFYLNGESLTEFESVKPGELGHVHIARPDPDRRIPKEEDVPALKTWAAELKKIGYRGRLSLECTWGRDFVTEWNEAIPLTRKIFD